MTTIRGVLLDLSGTLHSGDDALPGAIESVAELRAAGLRIVFVSNTSRKTRALLTRQLRALGFVLEETDLLTAPLAARRWLEQRGHRALRLVHPDLEAEFAGMDTRDPDAVLVADAGETFDYRRLNEAFRLLMRGAMLVATGVNRYFQEQDELSLDAGPFVRALEFASGRTAIVTGKPSEAFFHVAAAALALPPAELVMIGDDADNDVRGAVQAGLQGMLVRTGKYRAGDEARIDGAQCVADIGTAMRRILEEM